MERRISRRDLLKLAGAGVAASLIPSSERLEQEKKFFHNGKIGIEMSEFLHGIIDLKYYDEKKGEWVLYNNIVPEVRANGILNNAEMFGLKTRISRLSDSDEGQEIEIEYGKTDGEVWVGENHFVGNGARIKVVANIPIDGKYISFNVEEQDDSAPIEEVALSNFFGAAEKVRYLATADGIEDVLSEKFHDVKDGIWTVGKFDDFPLPYNQGGTFL